MQVAMKRRNSVGCAVFVEEPESDAEHDDRGNDRRVRRVTRQPGDGRRREQQQKKRIAHLAQEHRECRDPMHRQRIRARSTQPVCCLRRAQSALCARHAEQHVRNGQPCCRAGIELAGRLVAISSTPGDHATGLPVAAGDNVPSPPNG